MIVYWNFIFLASWALNGNCLFCPYMGPNWAQIGPKLDRSWAHIWARQPIYGQIIPSMGSIWAHIWAHIWAYIDAHTEPIQSPYRNPLSIPPSTIRRSLDEW